MAHPADKGGVRRAAVKIYHGRNVDRFALRAHGCGARHRKKRTKDTLKGASLAAVVTGSLSGSECPLSEREANPEGAGTEL
ncbi:hypothetical protein SGFS_048360 [Streptomyces graminofaciens]|jgi:hypothetical protein|uniref:Uncharacterized protein n=1 Tax=Streptomyces graminofaciens TaxID=68212 RepID=A0ABM7FBV8_9ACTN|nr:hypothetical protein SGFS_048360 [Streptomyces graminofaciens]